MRILWVDDEIETLRPHKIFLERQGFSVDVSDHPEEALNMLKINKYDLVLVDYRMPFLNGNEFVRLAKKIAPNIRYVLVTMVQDTDIMEEAISEDVFDYIVKPVKPTQILAVIKKIEKDEVYRSQKGKELTRLYQKLSAIPRNTEGWLKIADLISTKDPQDEFFAGEMEELNNEFAEWVQDNYVELLNSDITRSDNVFKKHVVPLLKKGEKVAFFVLDCVKLSQFVSLIKDLPSHLRPEVSLYYSILPTSTIYARNSIFAGRMPIEIQKLHPDWLKNNLHERELLKEQLSREHLPDNFSFYRLNAPEDTKNIKPGTFLIAGTINFTDLIAHIRGRVEPLKQLARTEQEFKDMIHFLIKKSGFVDRITELVREGYTVFLTSDHGWVQAGKPSIVRGGNELTESLRFKFGISLRVENRRQAVIFERPGEIGLPKGMGRLALCRDYYFFVYPSDPHRYAKRYKGEIMHGGVTLDEMIIPIIKIY